CGPDKPNTGWGNSEQEYYTDGTENAVIKGGALVITAMPMASSPTKYKCESTGTDKAGYTSARLTTKGKFEHLHGRFETRIEIPYGKGIWPAFWMLRNDFPTPNDWPDCGEIDIMENIGETADQAIDHGTLHGPGGSATYTDEGFTKTTALSSGKLADDFHIYA